MTKLPSIWQVTVMVIGLSGLQSVTALAQDKTLGPEAQTALNQGNYAAWDAPDQAIGPNHRTTFKNTKAGRRKIVELGTGMNYWDGTQWKPSNPSFSAANGEFVAGQVQHQVHLGNDLAVGGAVTVRTPEGILLHSTPLALALYDTASGDFQVISTVTSCTSTLVSSNEVMYMDAFSGGVCASVIYTITAGTFHQDVLITGHLDPQ